MENIKDIFLFRSNVGVLGIYYLSDISDNYVFDGWRFVKKKDKCLVFFNFEFY